MILSIRAGHAISLPRQRNHVLWQHAFIPFSYSILTLWSSVTLSRWRCRKAKSLPHAQLCYPWCFCLCQQVWRRFPTCHWTWIAPLLGMRMMWGTLTMICSSRWWRSSGTTWAWMWVSILVVQSKLFHRRRRTSQYQIL